MLLFHPYESFDPVVQLVSRPPTIPTCWRSSKRSTAPAAIRRSCAALVRAAENGKQVTVLVELKARFDEARNVDWARQLEDAGLLRDLRHRRLQDPRQGPADRPPRGAPHPPLSCTSPPATTTTRPPGSTPTWAC